MEIFRKKPNEKKITFFCEWFIDNNWIIIDSLEKTPQNKEQIQHILYEIRACLAVPYRDGFKGDIEFGFGFNADLNKYDLDLHHLNNKFLIQASLMIKEYLNSKLGNTWNVITSE